MKYLLFILAFVSIIWAADSTAFFHSDSMNTGLSTTHTNRAVDVEEFVLFDNAENTSDTMAAGDYLILGPFPLTGPNWAKEGQISYFNVIGKGLATGDNAQLAYQLTNGNAITDTSATWTLFDTCAASAGVSQTVVDLTQKSGRWLFIRVYNYTAGAIILPHKLYLYGRKKRPIN